MPAWMRIDAGAEEFVCGENPKPKTQNPKPTQGSLGMQRIAEAAPPRMCSVRFPTRTFRGSMGRQAPNID